MITPSIKELPRRGKNLVVAEQPASEGKQQGAPKELPDGPARVRMVVGVTSDQTCLVLAGRLRALRQAGFNVTLVASQGELLNRTAEREGVNAWPVSMVRQISPLRDLASLLVLCWVLIRVRPSLTDFSTPKAGLLGNLAAWFLGVPHRVYTLRGLKLQSARGWKLRVLLVSERLAASCAHVVLCNSESLRYAAELLKIAPREKLKVLGNGSSNGVDTVRFCPGPSEIRRKMGIGHSDPVVGFVGRLTRDKGIPELLEAFEAILVCQPNCWLLLVGWFDLAEDALGPRWCDYVAHHPRIRHVNFVEDTVEYYRSMDVLVLPTHREGFPNVALEAAACGIPVITTDSTGARDAVIPELTGLMISPGYPKAIVEAVLELLGGVTKRKRMGAAARVWVLERYSRDKVLDLAMNFYRDLIRDRRTTD